MDDAVKYLKKSIAKTYGRKGEEVVNMNYKAVDKGIELLNKVQVTSSWKGAKDDKEVSKKEVPDFIKNILEPMNRQEGDKLPVSTFAGMEDGVFPSGTAAYEKRGIAVNVPEWQIDKCIQCNQCSFVCPHAVIRPFLLNEEEVENKPESFETKKALGKGLEGLEYRIQISPLDCTGCGNCADICPAKGKALVMKPLEEQAETQIPNWEYAMKVSVKDDLMSLNSIKEASFHSLCLNSRELVPDVERHLMQNLQLSCLETG